jgi:hypothetical protein
MPGLPPVPLIIKCEIKGRWTGTPWVNIFHFGYTGSAPSGANLDAIAASAGNEYHADFMPMMPATVTLDSVKCTDLATLAGNQAEHAMGLVGSHAAAFTVPNSVALGIAWHTPTRYRGGHAKTFLPGMPSGALVDPIHWDPAQLTTANLAAFNWLLNIHTFTAGATNVNDLRVVHYRKNNVLLAAPTQEIIDTGTAKSMIYSQRGRRT